MRRSTKFWMFNGALLLGVVWLGFAACGDLAEGECDPELDVCDCDEDGENCVFTECDPETEDCICDENGENCRVPSSDTNNTQGSAQVSIEGYAFNPNLVTIAVGGTVTWTNNSGSEQHAPYSGTDGVIDCSLPNDGDVCTVTFDRAGSYTYEDRLHPGTVPEGTVIVR
jgi:plastocyanin